MFQTVFKLENSQEEAIQTEVLPQWWGPTTLDGAIEKITYQDSHKRYKGNITLQEDIMILDMYTTQGVKKWAQIADTIKLSYGTERSASQCKERFDTQTYILGSWRI